MPQPKSPCPVCSGTKVFRTDPNSLNFSAATHQCQTCGAKLTSTLKWRRATSTIVIGLFLVLLGLATYEASKQLAVIPQPVRFIAFLGFLGGVFGYSANRVIAAIEYKPWLPRQ